MFMYFFVLGAYIVCLCHLFIYEGIKLPALFTLLWIVGFVGSGFLGASAGMAFIAYQAILCVVMQFVLRARNLSYRL